MYNCNIIAITTLLGVSVLTGCSTTAPVGAVPVSVAGMLTQEDLAADGLGPVSVIDIYPQHVVGDAKNLPEFAALGDGAIWLYVDRDPYDVAVAGDGDLLGKGKPPVRLYFAFDRGTPIPSSVRELDSIVAQVARANGALPIRVIGHTDAIGSQAYNDGLSMRRARAVKKLLIQRGVPANKIEVVAMGERQPVASNRSEAGRKINRRAEVEAKENR